MSLINRHFSGTRDYGRQNTGRRHWGMGTRRIFTGSGGAGGAGAGIGAGTGAGAGDPSFLDRPALVNRASADTQRVVDNANAGAKARAAEMGLDYVPDQAGVLGGAGAVASAANEAGFKIDEANVGIKNRFRSEEHTSELQSH